MDEVLAGAVAVVVVDGHRGPVDGELLEVRAAVSVQLGVEIGEDASLEERIFGEVDAPYDVAWLELYGPVSLKFTLERYLVCCWQVSRPYFPIN